MKMKRFMAQKREGGLALFLKRIKRYIGDHEEKRLTVYKRRTKGGKGRVKKVIVGRGRRKRRRG